MLEGPDRGPKNGRSLAMDMVSDMVKWSGNKILASKTLFYRKLGDMTQKNLEGPYKKRRRSWFISCGDEIKLVKEESETRVGDSWREDGLTELL
ncbi:hypothetical protein L1887_01088 [Cichorium endivia]|nr:hypothetical protein L1887_01088 [Cichorium endivia]